MATTAGDQQRLQMLAAALFAAALTIVALRTIKAGREVAVLPLPVTDLQSLSPFLGPLRDSTATARNFTGAVVLARDPFAPTRVADAKNPARTTVGAHVSTAASEPWIVSSILVDGSTKSAIVNDAWVNIGDALGGGSRLTAVERDHIVVTDAKGVRHKVPIQGGESW